MTTTKPISWTQSPFGPNIFDDYYDNLTLWNRPLQGIAGIGLLVVHLNLSDVQHVPAGS